MEAVLNFLGIVKERFEVERVELEVVACLSGGNLASLELGVAILKGGMGKREWGTAESLKLGIVKMGILKQESVLF